MCLKELVLGRENALKHLVWLHGLGAGIPEEAQYVYQALMGVECCLHFVLAPVRRITVGGGLETTAWFDLKEASPKGTDLEDLHEITEQLAIKVAKLRKKHAHAEFYLAGFSQGAVVALNYYVRQLEAFKGVFALSGWLATLPTAPISTKVPLWIVHGLYDSVVNIQWAYEGVEILRAEGVSLEFNSYPMEHEIGQEVWRVLKKRLLT